MSDDNKKLTTYQQLGKFFNYGEFQQPSPELNKSGTNINQQPTTQKKILVRGNSPEDIQRKGLELLQKQDLQNKFFKTDERNFQKALQYEASRHYMYLDYESMEYYPLIASALDLFMEEATSIGDDGNMLNIYSNKDRIKGMLDEFFYDIVNVNVNLPFWTRNLPIKHDSMIPLLDGTELTIKELSEKLKSSPDETIWTYSVQDKTKNIVPGKIVWCELTRKDSVIVRVNLDDNTFVETTPDHEFLLRDGKHVKACDLKAGDSLMPYYTIETDYGFNYMSNIDHIDRNLISIEQLTKPEDVYCMEVVGPNGEHDRHNFPICSKNVDGQYTRNGVFVSNCKYGDNFVLNYGEKGKGITHVKQMVNYEVERMERVKNGKPNIGFKEKLTGDEFNAFEISHFRLLGDDKMLPYGSSFLNKIRRVWRMLIMAEDAMLTYRILRAGEKKIFKIDVGNMDEDDIEEYVYKVATKFKRTGQVNPGDGQIDYRFNILGNDEDFFLPVRNNSSNTGIETLPGACLALDTMIHLLDGRTLPLSVIIDEFKTNKDMWSYSIDKDTGDIVEGKISWAGITRKNTHVLKLVLDNNETITCTPDHKFPLKNGDVVEALHLKIDDELWLCSFDKNLPNNFKGIIKQVILLPEKQDTGTLTIDGHHEHHDHHNFALGCGVFTMNSNLNDIADIEYLRDVLFVGLGIPKPFLSFQDAQGGGKNMAQFDIRFTKKVNRIQQALIQELNKMAMIHLFLLGVDEKDITNFRLTLTNPSTQHELLKTELLREKAQVYRDLTDTTNGIAPMSHTEAKRKIFNMSDGLIVDDLKKQKLEMTIKQELVDSPVVIKKTGLFADIDNLYGEPVDGAELGGEQGEQPEQGGAGGGDDFPGDTGGDASSPVMGGGAGGDAPEPPELSEKAAIARAIKHKLSITEYEKYVTDMVTNGKGLPNNNSEKVNMLLESKNLELNTRSQNLVDEIDKLIGDDNKINTTKQPDNQEDDIDINNLNVD